MLLPLISASSGASLISGGIDISASTIIGGAGADTINLGSGQTSVRVIGGAGNTRSLSMSLLLAPQSLVVLVMTASTWLLPLFLVPVALHPTPTSSDLVVVRTPVTSVVCKPHRSRSEPLHSPLPWIPPMVQPPVTASRKLWQAELRQRQQLPHDQRLDGQQLQQPWCSGYHLHDCFHFCDYSSGLITHSHLRWRPKGPFFYGTIFTRGPDVAQHNLQLSGNKLASLSHAIWALRSGQ